MIWQWVDAQAIVDFNDEEAGLGVRDVNLLLSALARPQNLAAYSNPDIADLTACYAVGLVQNHAFIDGNKRTAWATAYVFLNRNGADLSFSFKEAEDMMVDVANHQITEAQVADWFRQRII